MGITGRPKSSDPKNVMATVRITARERNLLIDMHKTVNAGLRAALDAMLLNEVAGRGTPKPVRGEPTASAKGTRTPITEDSPTVIIDSLDYPGGRGKSKVMEDVIAVNGAGGGNPVKAKAHIHRPAVLVSSEHVRGELMETWSCECGHVLPARKAK